MLLVFAKWTIIGMVVEAIGFLNLFGCVCLFLLEIVEAKSTYHPLSCPFLQWFLPSHSQLYEAAAFHRKCPQCASRPRCESLTSAPSLQRVSLSLSNHQTDSRQAGRYSTISCMNNYIARTQHYRCQKARKIHILAIRSSISSHRWENIRYYLDAICTIIPHCLQYLLFATCIKFKWRVEKLQEIIIIAIYL